MLPPRGPPSTAWSEDEDVLQALLPGELSASYLTRRLDDIVRRSISRDGADRPATAADVGQQEQLFNACVTGDRQQAAAAISAGADPNADMRTVTPTRGQPRFSGAHAARPHARLRLPTRRSTMPNLLRPNILLHLVAGLGDSDMVKLLLAKGADPSAPDAVGDTALHLVCRVCHPIDVTIELVRLLKEAGALLDVPSAAGLTPIQQAAAAGNTAALLTLAEFGVPCDGRDSRGNTLLHAAVSSGCAHTVAAALERLPPAAVHVANKAGDTPLRTATCRETVRQLLAAGARADEPTMLALLKAVPAAVPDVLNHYMTTNTPSLDSSTLEVYLEYMPFWDAKRKDPAPETGVLRAVVDADQDELLKHPLVETFLHVKWQQIRHLFFMNFIFYVFFAIFVTSYGMLRVMHPYHTSTSVLAVCAGVFTISTVFREMFQLFYSWRLYVKSVENWLELAVMGLTSALLIGHGSEQAWVNHVVAWLMLATWLEMTLMVGRFPSIGIYIYMFVRVAQALTKFLLVYSPLLVAFALSFHVLFGATPAFRSIPLALIKTFVMMMGEYDYDGMFTSNETMTYPGTSHLLMIMFVLSMSIITVNLLIGLTVNDIQGLFKTAGVQRLRMTVIQILYIESVIYSDFMLMLFRARICQRIQRKLMVLPKLLLQQVDKHLLRQSKNSDEPNGEKLPSTPEAIVEANPESGRIMRAAFRPNLKGRPRLYRTTESGDLEPTSFVVENWMVKNMQCILRERAAETDRESREQLLQEEILAAVRAKTEPEPFWEAADTQPQAPPSTERHTSAGDHDDDSRLEEPVDGDGDTACRRRRHRKQAVPGRDAMDELGQKLNTVLAAVSEVSLKMGILERRLNMMDPPRLDTFYSV